MANTNDWGKIYCSTEWGDDDNIQTIKNEVAPDCLVNQYACGTQATYSGGNKFPTTYNVDLGSGTGTVTLTFNAQSIPDKFVVIYDGQEVINTGYRGDTAIQSELDTALANLGLPSETITSPGNGTATFNKTSTTPTATVKVYAPLASTLWSFTLSCPI